jgi:hypothetical protein
VRVPTEAQGKLAIVAEFDPAPLGSPVRARRVLEVQP